MQLHCRHQDDNQIDQQMNHAHDNARKATHTTHTTHTGHLHTQQTVLVAAVHLSKSMSTCVVDHQCDDATLVSMNVTAYVRGVQYLCLVCHDVVHDAIKYLFIFPL